MSTRCFILLLFTSSKYFFPTLASLFSVVTWNLKMVLTEAFAFPSLILPLGKGPPPPRRRSFPVRNVDLKMAWQNYAKEQLQQDGRRAPSKGRTVCSAVGPWTSKWIVPINPNRRSQMPRPIQGVWLMWPFALVDNGRWFWDTVDCHVVLMNHSFFWHNEERFFAVVEETSNRADQGNAIYIYISLWQ